MKHISHILAVIAAAGLLCGCDFLKESPTTKVEDKVAFSSEESLEAQITGIYSSLQSAIVNTNFFYFLNHASMMTRWKSTRSGIDYEQCIRGSLYTNSNCGKELLKSHYSIIYRCNNLIYYLKDSPVEDGFKTEIEAEAKMIRGLMYFNLVRLFGDVPLTLVPARTINDTYVERTSFMEVYRQILEDLTFAETNMRDAARQIAVSGLDGRPHKWAARSIKAQVYLQIGSILSDPQTQAFGTERTGEVAADFTLCGIDSAKKAWELALQTAQDIILNSGYELEPDYRNLYRWDPIGHPEDYRSKERILVLQSTPNGCTNMTSAYTLPERFYGTSHYTTHASNAVRINPSRWVFQKWAATYGGTPVSGAENTLTACPDPRFDATYIYGEYLQYDENDASSTVESYTYPYSNEYISKTANSPHFRKYFCPLFDQDAAYADFYLIRFAEIYLIAAEAAAEIGEETTAKDYIEVLHRRARNSVDASQEPAPQPTWRDGKHDYTGKELVNAIMWERVFELSGEGHEWFDNHRRGAQWLLSNIYFPLHEFLMETDQSSYRNAMFWYNKGYTVPLTLEQTRNALLCAYPEYEMRYNLALDADDQNYFIHHKALWSGHMTDNNVNTGNEEFDSNEDNIIW